MARSDWEELLAVMARLRAPGGCPWDREQTHQSLKKYVIEEAYEVAEAIDGGRPGALAEELGDLLLQIVFQAEIGRESGAFDIGDVIRAITAKLVRRHPHVFGEGAAATPAEVLHNWELIKKAEGKGRASLFDGVPAALPALRKAARVQQRASSVGFDWKDIGGPAAKLREEVGELDRAIASGEVGRVAEETGDVLFAAVNVSRHAGVEAEDALNAAVDKFRRRFARVEAAVAASGRTLAEATLEEMDAFWDRAKEDEGKAG